MALIDCLECGTQISDKATACVKCGAPIHSETKTSWVSGGGTSAAFDRIGTAFTYEPPPRSESSKSNWWKWLIGVPVGLFLLVMIFGTAARHNDPQTDAKDRGRAAIQLCWQDQQRKSFAAGTQQFVAGVCEKMENDFRSQFNLNP